ncbi:HAD family hydrolase [Halorientalis regularis]|jgi:FMN phosphatase YigB (HAD superfamily)|uniref:Putative hydrolase of the HAD superfamily n=1 Tax=Halorientalis regularis TaxID=660518 RepID=A0A1G7MAQ2_9EURY|nr:HAD family hydrolase [Halorientalis regularis]SDF58319.1 putative hydrolase of the HAD superfamily [Halorientalis regularis]
MDDRPPDAVFLDLDGTLCEYRRSREELLAAAFEELGVEPFFTTAEYREKLFMQVVTDETRAERREMAFASLAEESGRDPAVGRRLAALYASKRDHGDVEPLPGALSALDALGEAYDLALVANGGPEVQDPKLDALGVREAFDVIVYGGYDTAPKPEPGPFHEALYALDAAPRRAVHVGDTVYKDVRGADGAGIQAALLTDGSEPTTTPDYLLSSMADLEDPPWEDN